MKTKTAWTIVRTKSYGTVRYFEAQPKKPSKIIYEDDEWVLFFKIKARTKLEAKMITKLLTSAARHHDALE